MPKHITLPQLQETAQITKQYIDNKATAQVVRTETILWSGGVVQAGDILTLGQGLSNFDAIRVVAGATSGSTWDNLLRNSLSQEYDVDEFINALAIQIPILPRLIPELKVFLSLRLAYDTNTTIRVATIERDVVSSGSASNYIVGIYSIKGINYVPMENYSTTEQIVGTWTDGRPVYRKVIDCGALPNTKPVGANNYEKKVLHGITNLDRVINGDFGTTTTSTGVTIPVNYIYLDNNVVQYIQCSIRKDEGNIVIRTSQDLSAIYTRTTIDIKYIKTSET